MTVLNAFYAFATYGKSAKFYFISNCTFGAVLAPASAEKRAFGEAPANPATRFVGNWRMVVLNACTVSL